MAKVTITITDDPNNPEGAHVQLVSDPPIIKDDPDPPLSQLLGLEIVNSILGDDEIEVMESEVIDGE